MSRIVYKATQSNGTDFYTGTINYAEACANKKPVEILDASPPSVFSEVGVFSEVCGHGIHVSPTAIQTVQFSDKEKYPWRWFVGTVDEADIIAEDRRKLRCRKFLPTKEIFLKNVFGATLANKIEDTKKKVESWKNIPWFQPDATLDIQEVELLVRTWSTALEPWCSKNLPSKVQIVRHVDDVRGKVYPNYSYNGFNISYAAYAVSSAAIDAIAVVVANALVEDLNALVEDLAEDLADNVLVDLGAMNLGNGGCEMGAACSAIVLAEIGFFNGVDHFACHTSSRLQNWFLRPYNLFGDFLAWEFSGLQGKNPFESLVELYKLGCVPLGYTDDEKFVVFCSSF